MNKKRKKMIIKIILFLFIASLIIFGIRYINKEDDKINEPSINNPSDVDKKDEGISKEPGNIVPDPFGTSYLNKIIYKEKLDKEVEKVIVEYMDVYYKSMKELKEYDMTYLFSDENSMDAYINQTALSLLIEIRKLKPTDLTLDKVKYDLEVTEVANGDTIKVKVLEDNYLNFNFMKEIESKIYNIENEFVLQKIGDEYKIVEYKKVQDFFVMVTDKYKSGGKEELDKIKKDYLELTKNNVDSLEENYSDFLNNKGHTLKNCDNNYDRKKAYQYAINWVNKRNSEWSSFGSNCQNYASQMLFAGGIPNDHIGSASDNLQWKFYDSNFNANETETGYVYTWTYVPFFREYVMNNTGSGLCANVDVNLYYAEAGDLITVGSVSKTRHVVAVIGDYKIDNKTVDILVNSNSVDLENYPMSAYVYPYTSLIKIYGWNN